MRCEQRPQGNDEYSSETGNRTGDATAARRYLHARISMYTRNNNPRKGQLHTTMLNPNVHVMGEEGACIAYVRLTQFMDRNGEARTRQTQESRVWQKKAGRWVSCVLYLYFIVFIEVIRCAVLLLQHAFSTN
ncbi:Calcium/calmodulin dependent protein kinase II Association [Ostertagia ostertagi]